MKNNSPIVIVMAMLIFSGTAYCEESAGSLFSMLLSRDQKENRQALNYLKKNRPADLPAKILDRLRSGRYGEQKALFEALKFYPQKELVQPCLEILRESDSYILKRDLIEFMAELRDRSVVLPIAKELTSPHQPVRISAAMALRKNGDDRMYPVILAMAGHENPVHRIYFIEAMNYLYDKRFYSHLVEMMRDENKSIRIYVINCFRKNQLMEAAGIIRNAGAGDRNDEVRISAIEAMGEMKDNGASYVLVKALNERNRDLRLAAARAFIQIGSYGAAEPLSSRLMVEDDPEIKDSILDGLMNFKRGGDLRGVEKVLASDSDYRRRVKSAYILGAIRDQRAVGVIYNGLSDSDYKVRAELCDALGNYKSRQTINRLLEIIEKDPITYVRTAALYSIKTMLDRQTLVSLFDIYSMEREPLFRDILGNLIRDYIRRHI
ncbi:MAG: HEAT repeat domain-containing protein [Spirochaetes bacterium]|jgi:HEAT repeat protein|nr:HEAT repeat domain-containing protein [Spirochaetota bacterium]